MFTQIGLNNLWADLKAGACLESSDIQIVCDSEQERCMKIYISSERRYTLFSSKRSTSHTGAQFSIWIRTNAWQPFGSFFKREQLAVEKRFSWP